MISASVTSFELKGALKFPKAMSGVQKQQKGYPVNYDRETFFYTYYLFGDSYRSSSFSAYRTSLSTSTFHLLKEES